jgi:hypothetical protein
MSKLGLEWTPSRADTGDPPFDVHVAGGRVPRVRSYGPRVTGGNPAWERLGRR